MRYQKLLLLETRQARACKARVPKLELGNQRNFRVELGYLNQDFDNANHAVNIVRHLIMGTLFINF